MHEGFEGWVRVLCCGPLAYAAMTASAIPNIPLAVACGVLAIGFAIWPERLAYAYRKNKPLPFWSKPTSITGRDAVGDELPADTFATYRPRLLNLFNAYFSISWYLVLGFNIWRVPAMQLPFVILIGAGILLLLVGRTES